MGQMGKRDLTGPINSGIIGMDARHEHDVGFRVDREEVGAVISISSRLISIRITAGPHDVTIVQLSIYMLRLTCMDG